MVDVFEKLIFTCLKYYDLDPCHYFSTPGLSWDAILKMNGVALVILIKDIAKHLEISIFSILTCIIYIDALWVNIYLLVILSGSKT